MKTSSEVNQIHDMQTNSEDHIGDHVASASDRLTPSSVETINSDAAVWYYKILPEISSKKSVIDRSKRTGNLEATLY